LEVDLEFVMPRIDGQANSPGGFTLAKPAAAIEETTLWAYAA